VKHDAGAVERLQLDKLAASDPGIDTGVLQLEAASPWTLAFDNLAADVRGKALFVVNERPGRHWQAGKALMEQPLSEQLAYVQKAFAEGTLIAGGPVDGHQGRYIIAPRTRPPPSAGPRPTRPSPPASCTPR
jgi:hypothetical protein